MTAFTTDVTHAWPSRIEAGGCSEFLPLGTTQDTAGKVPAAAFVKKSCDGWT
jgi:hypothetical protein